MHGRLKQVLARISETPEVEARWLNTVSLLEFTGARKIGRTVADRHPSLEVLQHLLACRRGEGRLDPFEENILGDILVAMDAIDDANQIDAHSSPPRHAQVPDGRPPGRDAVRTIEWQPPGRRAPADRWGWSCQAALRGEEHRLREGSRRPRPHGILGAGSEPSPGRAEPDVISPTPAQAAMVTPS